MFVVCADASTDLASYGNEPATPPATPHARTDHTDESQWGVGYTR